MRFASTRCGDGVSVPGQARLSDIFSGPALFLALTAGLEALPLVLLGRGLSLQLVALVGFDALPLVASGALFVGLHLLGRGARISCHAPDSSRNADTD